MRFFPARQCFIQLQLPDNLPHRSCGNVAHTIYIIGNSISRFFRTNHLIENDRVDLHLHVILGDYGLRRHIGLLNPQIMVGPHLINNRNQNIQTRCKQPMEFTETLHNPYPLLRYDFDRKRDKNNDDSNNNTDNCPFH